jgi:hypothetical protein
MAMSASTSAARNLVTGVITWTTGTWNLGLLTNTYTFSAAHDFRDDWTNEVANGNGYTTGGLTLDNRTASSANPSVLTADDEVIAQNASGFANARKYWLVKITGGASSTDPLFYYGTAAGDFGNQNGALTLDVPSSWITVTV